MADPEWTWTSGDWEQMWAVGDTPWNEAKPNVFFDEHEEEMFRGGRKRVFVPLCGKSKDMVWLHEHGHTVIGVDIAEKPIRDFFEENKISADTKEVEGVGKVYKSNDGRVELYAANIFNLTSEIIGMVDIIWDSAAFTAINQDENDRYIELASSVMKGDSSWYLYTIEYDCTVWPGPPQSFSEERVKEIFGSRFTIEKIFERDLRRSVHYKAMASDFQPSKKIERIERGLKQSSYMIHRRLRLTPTSGKQAATWLG